MQHLVISATVLALLASCEAEPAPRQNAADVSLAADADGDGEGDGSGAIAPDIQGVSPDVGGRSDDAGAVAAVDSATDDGAPDVPVRSVPDGWRDLALAAAAGIDAAPLLAAVSTLSDDAFQGRDNLTPGGKAAREWLESRLAALGVEPAGAAGWEQPFPDGVNVVGRVTGATDEVIVLSAHYDHLGAVGAPHSQCYPDGSGDPVCHGAADNASGCAALLAVAEALRTLPQPRRTVLFALFDAEEDGLLGSSYFADQEPLVPLDSIVAALNLDTIGTTIIPGAGSSFALGVEYVDGLTDLVTADAGDAGLVVYPVSSFFDGSDDGERSDHYSLRRAGVPSLFLSGGAPAQYHTPSDVPAVLDPDKLALTTRHVFLLAADLAFGDRTPTLLGAPQPHIGDAVALADLGDRVLAAPAAVGVTDPMEIQFLETIVARLHQYVEAPPATPAEWAEYDTFVRGVIDTVYSTIGR